jgi:hypothetical protein
MARFELTKTIEAVKLNKRTMRVLGPERFTIPFGALLDGVTTERNHCRFFYLGEPYEVPESEIGSALREVK